MLAAGPESASQTPREETLRDENRLAMESPQKADVSKSAKPGKRKSSESESDEDLEPPSPIQIAPEAAMTPEFDFPDPHELRRIESDTQNRLKAILEVAGVTGLSQIDARTFQDPEILRKLTNRFADPRYSTVVT